MVTTSLLEGAIDIGVETTAMESFSEGARLGYNQTQQEKVRIYSQRAQKKASGYKITNRK